MQIGVLILVQFVGMMSGTIMGEIRIAMIAPRKGTCRWLRPTAARVPSVTAISVATGAMRNEFQSAFCQSVLVKKSR